MGFETNKEVFDTNCNKIKKQLEEYHKLYDIYNSYDDINNLYTVNKHQRVKVDKRITDLLQFSCDMYDVTNQKLNIAMGSVLKIWHNYRSEGKEIPPESLLETANEHTNPKNIIIDNGTVFLADNQMLIDVGAVAKGYTAEQIAKWMKSQGFNGYILNIGGNVCTVGNRPDGKKWEIGIENPDNTEEFAETLSLGGDMALVTSGSYQRFYTVDGKNYHHIIDPSTLMPADYFKSVSVLCESSAVADLLSTALFCMSYQDGIELLQGFENTEAMWIKKDGQKLFTDGFKKQ